MAKVQKSMLAAIAVWTAISCGRALAANATVTIADYSFTDSSSGTSSTSVVAGDTVTWNWSAANSHAHSTTSGTCGGSCSSDGKWDSGLRPGGSTFSQIFSTPGTFHYFCSNHLTMMQGQVIVTAATPPPPPPTPSVCIPSATVLCIDDQPGDKRFQVEASYHTAQSGGSSGLGQTIPLTSVGVSHGGILWFFSADNPELLVKVLNTCSFSNRIWVFASAGTNVAVTLTVTDTKTGAQKTYTNADQHSMDPIQDTDAFATCP